MWFKMHDGKFFRHDYDRKELWYPTTETCIWLLSKTFLTLVDLFQPQTDRDRN